jgi:hypothetical protein
MPAGYYLLWVGRDATRRAAPEARIGRKRTGATAEKTAVQTTALD